MFLLTLFIVFVLSPKIDLDWLVVHPLTVQYPDCLVLQIWLILSLYDEQ